MAPAPYIYELGGADLKLRHWKRKGDASTKESRRTQSVTNLFNGLKRGERKQQQDDGWNGDSDGQVDAIRTALAD